MKNDESKPTEDGRAVERVLALGAAIGLIAALASVVHRADVPNLPTGAAASVNGKPISDRAVTLAVAMLEGDRRIAAVPADRDAVLARLIEEELLVQRALQLGLVESDGSVRKALVRAMLDSITIEAESEAADEAALREFFAANRGLFRGSALIDVERIEFRDRPGALPARERAESAAATLRSGASIDDVRRRFGDAARIELPAAPLQARELVEYLGPTAARSVLALEPGAVAGPFAADAGWQVLRVLDRQQAGVPSFAEARALIESAYRKQRIDEAVRDYLERLERAADIVVRESGDRVVR